MKSIKIYTRTGDKGTTSLFTGQRLSKTNIVFDCMGSVDELTSLIGISREYCSESCFLRDQLYKVQCCLQDINSHIATPPYHAADTKRIRTAFDHGEKLSNELEQWIDEMEKELPILRNFILPSGGMLATHLHLSRAVTRRAERFICELLEDCSDQEYDRSIGIYLNRLGDYFFMAARYSSNVIQGSQDVIYQRYSIQDK